MVKKWILIFKERRAILKEISSIAAYYEYVINDPLNGCPGDFADDRERKLLVLANRGLVLGLSVDKMMGAEWRGVAIGDKQR